MKKEITVDAPDYLKKQLYNQENQMYLYAVITLFLIGVGIYIWRMADFDTAFPIFITAIISIEVVITKFKLSKTLQAYIKLIELITKKLSEENNQTQD